MSLKIISSDVAKNFNKRLKIIANHSVTDNLDALKSIGIVVTNTPDVLSDATAEISMLLLLGAARRAVEAQISLKKVKLFNFQVQRLGIIGMGSHRPLEMLFGKYTITSSTVYHNFLSDFLSLH